jgi:DNA-binding phage protein
VKVDVKRPSIQNARFVRDELSRVLALSDALASENGTAICAAFLDVAQARGVAQIACDTMLSEDAIYAALADPAKPDTRILRQVVESMLRVLPKNDRGASE